MNHLKAIVANFRFLDSPLGTRLIATRSLQLTRNQVTHFSLYSPSTLLDRSHDFRFSNIHHKLYFSSKPNSIVELVLTSDWSKGLEHDLEKCCPSLTHETVVYVLKRLEGNPEKAWCFFNWVSTKQWFRASSSLYGLVLRVLATEETIKQFWITLWTMKRKGFYFDEEMYFPVLAGFRKKEMNNDCASLTRFYNRSNQENAMQRAVTKVVNIISGSEWGYEVMGELARLKIHLSDNFVTRVLKELRNCPLKALELFRWVEKKHSGYEHNTVTYNAIARVLARTDSIEEFWSVIEEMKSVGHELDIDTYIKISRMLQKNRMMEDAVKLYELMMDGSYKPSVEDCSLLLKSISASDEPSLDLVFRVSTKYESTGHTLSKAIYDGIHRSLTSSGKLDEAENVVNVMRNAGYEPDNITYSQVIFGFCKMKRLEEACKVLEEMESCGCIPDIKTWTILIQGHCVVNEVDQALLCLYRMIEKGCNADATILGVLIDSFLSQKRIEDAYKLLVEMVSKCGTSPWLGTYKKLIENLLGIEKFEEALDLLCLMRKHKYTPFIEPFVQYISRFGSVEDAVNFLKAWSKGSPQSHSAYVHVFKSLLGEGRLSEAKDLLSKIRCHISKREQIRELFDSVENCTVHSLGSMSQTLIPSLNPKTLKIAKAIAASLRMVELSLATRIPVTRNQVTHFSLHNPLPLSDRSHYLRFPITHHKLYFSTKPHSILELLLTNDWSQALEHQLENRCPSMTHETVLYVIKRLDKNPEKASSFFNWVSKKEWFRASSSVYSLIVRVLATKDTMKQFWVTLRMMKEKGFYLDEETYLTISVGFKKAKMNSDSVALSHFYDRMLQENAMQSVVTKVVGIISLSEWGDEVMGELAKLKIELSDNFVIRVLKELRNTPLKAYKFFHWVGKQSGYGHNTVTYNAVARVLARTDSIEEFWSVIEEMESVGHELDIDTYIKVSRQLQKNKMMEDAVKLYELMMDGSCKPLVQDCSILLKSISASDKPNLDLVFRVVKKFESAGHTLSKAIYDGIHRSLTGAGNLDEAENIIRAMRNAGYEPDNITYSQVVFGLCKMRRFEEACKVLEEMESCGCVPDIKTWTILIQGHCDANEIEKASICFAKMIEKGCDPDADLLDVLVDGFLSRKRIEGAYDLVTEISSKCRISPWQATYKKLIEKLLGVMKFEEALKLLRLMKSHNYPPYHEPFVPYISKFGSVEDAEQFLKALSVKSYPSHTVYNQEGRLSEAKDLLYKSPHHI
ncbi:Pentatricopeptide repeat-containing protein, chloroplastic, partial [Mucuna pruriens]